MAYLLDGDPAIRWQVMRDLTDAPADEVAAERAKVASEGWGARMLSEQGADGLWDGGTYRPGWADESRPFFDAWTATHFSLMSLVGYGLDPESPEARRAIALVRENARWDYNDELYFQGETEPCINGGALAVGAYFGEEAAPIAATILETQHADGGWNCCEEDPATPSSFHSTICALEGLWAWEQVACASDEVRQEIKATVRRELGAIAVISDLNFVNALPKPRSGKIMRRVLKAVTLDVDPGDISTIEDEGSVEDAREAWAAMKSEVSAT